MIAWKFPLGYDNNKFVHSSMNYSFMQLFGADDKMGVAHPV
jgi:hypothetical protein